MKRKINTKALLTTMVVALLMGVLAANVAQSYHVGLFGQWATLFVTFATIVALAFMPRPSHLRNMTVMGISVEIWQDHIEGNLFKGNEFMNAMTDASQYVQMGKIVHIPQAGAVANVEKDRSSLPASVGQRTDTDVTYTLAPFTTDPILIPEAEIAELSYNKRESVLAEHENALRERIAEDLLITIAPTAAGTVIRTTGAPVDSTITDTTGYRKAITLKDLKAAKTVLDKQKVAQNDRYALMSADMYKQFTDELEAKDEKDFSRAYDEKTGVIGKLYGFNIMMRPTVVTYNAAASAVNAYGASAAATDNDAVLCWQKSAVERAVGEIKFFEQVDAPTFYGTVYSFLVRMGGRRRRSDSKGIVAIVQDAAVA